MAKYVVTGGAGFIGSHLVDALIEAGHEVVAFDNLSSGKKANLNPRAIFYHGDIRDGESVLDALTGAVGVFHLAARARVPVSIKDPLGTHDVNVSGTLVVLDAARKAGVCHVVFASSSSVYGDKKSFPVCETDSLRPKSPYGWQKLMGEQYCAMHAGLYGLRTVCLRFFNVYGPRFDPRGAYALVIGKFLTQRQAGTPLTVTGDGTQTRDFTHVSDVVRACMLAMGKLQVHSGGWPIGAGEAINIGAGNPASINWLATTIGGKDYPVERIAARDEPKATHASNLKAANRLGWRPQVQLEDGIRDLMRQSGL